LIAGRNRLFLLSGPRGFSLNPVNPVNPCQSFFDPEYPVNPVSGKDRISIAGPSGRNGLKIRRPLTGLTGLTGKE
jgi:hypothetical protein